MGSYFHQTLPSHIDENFVTVLVNHNNLSFHLMHFLVSLPMFLKLRSRKKLAIQYNELEKLHMQVLINCHLTTCSQLT